MRGTRLRVAGQDGVPESEGGSPAGAGLEPADDAGRDPDAGGDRAAEGSGRLAEGDAGGSGFGPPARSGLGPADDAGREPDAGGDRAAEGDGRLAEGDVGSHRQLGLPSKAVGWAFLLAVVVAVIAANALLSHWSAKTRPHEVGSGPLAQPDPRQAASVAQREFGLLSGGGWAQAWQLWSVTARSALSQDDFVRLNTECRPALGVPYVIDLTTPTDDTTVSVTWHQASAAGTATVVYENGAWRFTPDAQTLADYRQGADSVIAERKAAGRCR